MTDKSNYLKILEDFPMQCRQALGLPKDISTDREIKNIVVCGMGGSAIGGNLLKSFMSNTNIPVTVVKDYNIPNIIDDSSLVFAVSYSGDTEETLSCFAQAKERNAELIAITSGGRLAAECEKKIIIPKGLQPRAAIGYLFLPMLSVLHNSKIINLKNSELNEMLSIIRDVEFFNEQGEELSKKMRDKTPIIYSSALLEPVAYRIKCEINENSKQAAFHHVFPEMNHNELVGFEKMSREKFVVIMIKDVEDHERIKKRMEICKEIMERTVDVEEIHTKGDSLLARMFSTIYLGDMASYYLALYNRVDPTPVDVISYLKKQLTM